MQEMVSGQELFYNLIKKGFVFAISPKQYKLIIWQGMLSFNWFPGISLCHYV